MQRNDLVVKKPYKLGIENETQVLFCLTDDDEKYQIYRYDTNEDEVFHTNMTFASYIMKVTEEGRRNWEKLGVPAMVFETDLLEIWLLLSRGKFTINLLRDERIVVEKVDQCIELIDPLLSNG
jgi:hypothetical protein